MTALDILPIGSFSIFVNTNSLWDEFPDQATQQSIATAIVTELQKRLGETEYGESIVITDIRVTVGCIIITISLGTLTAGGVVAAAYNVVKDFDKLEANVPKIINGFKNIWIKITRSKSSPQTKPEVEILNELPAEALESITGQLVVPDVHPEKETKLAKIAVMRDEILDILKLDNIAIKMDVRKDINSHLKFQDNDPAPGRKQ